MNHEFKDQSASQRTDTTNYRTYIRNVPSQNLQPYLDSRAVSTKYDSHQVFNPGNAKAPFSGYNANQESVLRNQIYALQDCSQATYVPSSKSDLYQVHWKQSDLSQPFPDLFQQQVFPSNNSYIHSKDVGYALFNNATRQQNKNVNC